MLKIPRYLPMDQDEDHEIHIFSDASESAYCSLAFLRYFDKSLQKYKVRFIIARTKLKPLKGKGLTICRLELLSCILTRDLIGVVQRAFNTPSHRIFAWSDSQVCIAWIQKGDYKSLSVWVANRVQLIQETGVSFSWIEGSCNPSDLGTRKDGLPVQIMKEFTHGPAFLTQPRSEWDKYTRYKFDKHHANYDLYLAEFKPEKILQTFFVQKEDNLAVKLLNQTNHLDKMLLLYAIWLRFRENLQNKVRIKKSQEIVITSLKEHMDRSLIYFVAVTQEEHFEDELCDLQEGAKESTGNSAAVSKQSRLKRLNVFIDRDGILRCRGRLSATTLPYETKYPFVLPSKSKLTFSILLWAHNGRFTHANVNTCQAYLNNFCHILDVRQRIKWVIKTCKECNVFNAILLEQRMGPLPESRYDMNPGIFCRVGCDLAGPIMTSSARFPRSKKKVKVWLVIFTDQVSRFTWCTWVESLSAEALLTAILRVYNLYGPFKEVYCDQGSNLIRADIELKNFFNKDSQKFTEPERLETLAAKKDIKFVFSPAGSSWRSGFVEAYVQLVKQCLKKVFGKQIISDANLTLQLDIISGYLNDRPISTVYAENEPTDPSHYLTPRMLLLGKSSTLNFFDLEQGAKTMTVASRWKQRLHLFQKWQILFKRNYLLHMRSLDKWLTGKKDIKEGEICLLHDSSPLVRRMNYPMVRIVKLYKHGADGKVRTCDVRLGDGDPQACKRGVKGKQGTILRTSVNNLYRLECFSFENRFNEYMRTKDSPEYDCDPPKNKPKARKRRKRKRF